jgi:hypothetical protein
MFGYSVLDEHKINKISKVSKLCDDLPGVRIQTDEREVYTAEAQAVFMPSRIVFVLPSWPNYEQPRSPESEPGQFLEEVEINDSGVRGKG